MNQFQALFESFLTINGVPAALTFCNEVRSPYLPAGVPPQQKERVNGQTEMQGGIARLNLICHKKTREREEEEMRSGCVLKWQLREDDRSNWRC